MADVDTYGDMYAEDDTAKGAITRAWLKDVGERNKQFQRTLNDRDSRIAELELKVEELEKRLAHRGWQPGAIDV